MALKTAVHGNRRAEYDPDADALYVYVSERDYHHGRDLDESRRIDYAVDGSPIGIELLSPAAVGIDVTGLPFADTVTALAHALGLPVLSPRRQHATAAQKSGS